jgi:hypothetical protein
MYATFWELRQMGIRDAPKEIDRAHKGGVQRAAIALLESCLRKLS